MGGAANIGSALATDPLTYSVTRGLAGAAFSATITAALIYFGDTLTMKQRAVATANLAAAISLGLAAGTARYSFASFRRMSTRLCPPYIIFRSCSARRP